MANSASLTSALKADWQPTNAPKVSKLLPYCQVNVYELIIVNVQYLRTSFKPYCRIKMKFPTHEVPSLWQVAWWWGHVLSNQSYSTFASVGQLRLFFVSVGSFKSISYLLFTFIISAESENSNSDMVTSVIMRPSKVDENYIYIQKLHLSSFLNVLRA